jgi:hypothetical protein
VTVIHGGDISTPALVSAFTEAQKKAVRFDPDLLANTTSLVGTYTFAAPAQLNENNVLAIDLAITGANERVVRRLTTIGGNVGDASRTVTVVVEDTGGATMLDGMSLDCTFTSADNFDASDTLGAIQGAPAWALKVLAALSRRFGCNAMLVNRMTSKRSISRSTALLSRRSPRSSELSGLRSWSRPQRLPQPRR